MDASPPKRATAAQRSRFVRTVDLVERAAAGASLLCLVHCLLLPFVLAAMLAVASTLDIPESVHGWLLAFALPTSALALGAGYRDTRLAAPPAVGIAGLFAMGYAYLLHAGTSLETVWTVAGSLMLASAHLANWRNRHADHKHG